MDLNDHVLLLQFTLNSKTTFKDALVIFPLWRRRGCKANTQLVAVHQVTFGH